MKIVEWLKAHVVEDWREGWKWASVRAQGIAAVYVAAWLLAPDAINDAVGPNASKVLLISLLILGLGGRFVVQGFRTTDGQGG